MASIQNQVWKKQKVKSTIDLVFGWILTVVGVFFGLAFLSTDMDEIFLFLLFCALPFLCGGVLLFLGYYRIHILHQYSLFLPRLNSNPEMTAKELAMSLRKKEDTVRPMLRKLANLHFFGNAYFDDNYDKVVLVEESAMVYHAVQEDAANEECAVNSQKFNIFKQWWFYVVVGVLIIAAIVTVIIINTPSAGFKEDMDEYERFVNSYISAMKKYEDGEITYADFLKVEKEYGYWLEKMSKYDFDRMKKADYKYYIKVTDRIEDKLLRAMYDR